MGWKIARQWALVRANEHCEHCGAAKKYGDLGVHHVRAYRFCKTDAEANSPKNLIVLCRSCHARVHRLGEVGIRGQDGRFISGERKVISGAHRQMMGPGMRVER